jgi:acetylornithine deacetylase/succinyl-diaminopimelate desuccinylase-like protein
MDWDTIGAEAIEILGDLIRIETVNPPGGEIAAARYLERILKREGIECRVFEPVTGRGSVVARLRSSGSRGPVLLHGHLDTVPVENPQAWLHPPFSGEIADGCIWGRGALDMKGPLTMGLITMLTARRQGWKLEGDLIFTAVADEETGTTWGSRWLVEHHPDLVRARVALGEMGGFGIAERNRVLFPIQVGEKGAVRVVVRFRGTSGHGSLVPRDHVVARAGAAADRLVRQGLPHHEVEVSRRLLEAMAEAKGGVQGRVLRLLRFAPLRKALLNGPLRSLPQAPALVAMFANTANPNIIRAGEVINQVPELAELHLDGRLLPGQDELGFTAELERLFRGLEPFDIELGDCAPPTVSEWGGEVYEALASAIQRNHPRALTSPFLLPGYTDARNYSKVCSHCYGFYPIEFPPGLAAQSLAHGRDERLPLEGFRWGIRVLHDAVKRLLVAE